MEYCSRAIVLAVQVTAGMWKRNGYSIVNQIINYQYHHSKEIMYDKDVLMLQVMIFGEWIEGTIHRKLVRVLSCTSDVYICLCFLSQIEVFKCDE